MTFYKTLTWKQISIHIFLCNTAKQTTFNGQQQYIFNLWHSTQAWEINCNIEQQWCQMAMPIQFVWNLIYVKIKMLLESISKITFHSSFWAARHYSCWSTFISMTKCNSICYFCCSITPLQPICPPLRFKCAVNKIMPLSIISKLRVDGSSPKQSHFSANIIRSAENCQHLKMLTFYC